MRQPILYHEQEQGNYPSMCNACFPRSTARLQHDTNIIKVYLTLLFNNNLESCALRTYLFVNTSIKIYDMLIAAVIGVYKLLLSFLDVSGIKEKTDI